MARILKSYAGNQAGSGLVMFSLAVLLAGCSGNTYGTGVSSQAQLAKDIGGMVSLGTGGRERTVIDYNARPKLVKVEEGGSLPAPAERAESESAYFPTNPEEARAARYRERVDPSVRGEQPLGATSAGPATAVDLRESAKKVDELSRDPSASQMLRESVDGRQERARRIAEINGVGRGVGPRRYLTEPPAEYRTPAETAPTGEVGEKEVKRKKKRGKSFVDNPFKDIF